MGGGDDKYKTMDMVYKGAGAWLGATAAGSFSSGAPLMDVATAISGGAGGALGYMAGSYLSTDATVDKKLSKAAQYLPLAGAILVPGLASGMWDKNTILIGVGAFVGGMLGAAISPTPVAANMLY